MKDRSITAEMLREIADKAKPQINAKAYDLICRKARAAAANGKYSTEVMLDVGDDELSALMDKLDGDGFKTMWKSVQVDDDPMAWEFNLHVSWEKPKAKKEKK